MIEGWIERELREIVNFGNGKRKPDSDGEIPIYGGNGILGYSADSNYDGETIVIGRVGAYCGSVYFANKPVWVSDNALAATPKNDNNASFLFYHLKHMELNAFAGGSSQPLVTQTILNSLQTAIPRDPNEQKAIAEILSSLDDKIDLLHRQNATLEALAETLFRQTFIEEAQDDWEEKPISAIARVAIGRTPPRKEFHWFSKSNNDWKWLSIKDMADGDVFALDTTECLTAAAVERFNVPVIPPNTVMLSFKMTVGRVAISTESMLSNEAIAHFKLSQESGISKEFLFLFLKCYPYQQLGSTSSIVTAINSRMIKEIIVTIPSHEAIDKFQDMVEPMFGRILENQIQIQTLEKLRDTLLPKLMSGAVRVEYERPDAMVEVV